jgi:two-component sensor histidine kinase
LQSVAGLLRLQSRKSGSEETKTALEIAQGRIASVSDIHDLLSQADATGRIDMGQYIERFRDHVKGMQPENVGLHTEFETMMVSSRVASGLGIIINEFFANAFKHAFPDNQSGMVNLSLRNLENGEACLVCSDNGRGIAEAPRVGDGGLGMQIMEAMADQIGSKIVRASGDSGTSVTLTFALT